MPSQDSYLKLLRKFNCCFECPLCPTTVLPEEFEQHCSSHHALDDNRCPWCMGHTSWYKKDFKHLQTCFLSFLKSHENGPYYFTLEPMCSPEELLLTKSEDNLWPAVLDPPSIPFTDSGLNAAVSCIELFLKENADFHHILLRESGLPQFQKALEDGTSRTLPFSCHCTGGGTPHRHLILVTEPKGHFKRLFKKMKGCRKDPIRSPMALVRLMGHLSQPHSHCQFSFETLPGGAKKHFQIGTALPHLYRLICTLLWEGGFEQLLHEMFDSEDPRLLIPFAESSNGLWSHRVELLPYLPPDLTLPVAPTWQLASRETGTRLHLLGGRKVYLEETDEREEEVRIQLVYPDNRWFPTPSQQTCIQGAKDMVQEVHESMERRLESDANELKTENVQLKRKLQSAEEQFQQLQGKYINVLERENDILRMEMKRQKV